MTTITAAIAPVQLESVRGLMRAFISWHRERHKQEEALIDRYFNPVEFEAELAGLPGKFAPPEGRLLLATFDGRPAGCVALRDLGGNACEMKCMFVYPEFHGQGLGRVLAEAIIKEAQLIGYAVMRLDTGMRQIEAQNLYRRLGFQTVSPYYDLPDDLKSWLVFMELDLRKKS